MYQSALERRCDLRRRRHHVGASNVSRASIKISPEELIIIHAPFDGTTLLRKADPNRKEDGITC